MKKVLSVLCIITLFTGTILPSYADGIIESNTIYNTTIDNIYNSVENNESVNEVGNNAVVKDQENVIENNSINEKIPNAQCHYSDENGKIVVTLETECIDEEICLLRQIEKLQGVVLAQMIYAYHNAELEILQENIQRQDAVPEVLKNNKVKAEEIGYNGDVQGKLDNILKNVL